MKKSTLRTLGLGLGASISGLMVAAGGHAWGDTLGIGLAGGYATSALIEASILYAYGMKRTILGGALALAASVGTVYPMIQGVTQAAQDASKSAYLVTGYQSQIETVKSRMGAVTLAYTKTQSSKARASMEADAKVLAELEAAKAKAQGDAIGPSDTAKVRVGLSALVLVLLLMVQGVATHGTLAAPTRKPATTTTKKVRAARKPATAKKARATNP